VIRRDPTPTPTDARAPRRPSDAHGLLPTLPKFLRARKRRGGQRGEGGEKEREGGGREGGNGGVASPPVAANRERRVESRDRRVERREPEIMRRAGVEEAWDRHGRLAKRKSPRPHRRGANRKRPSPFASGAVWPPSLLPNTRLRKSIRQGGGLAAITHPHKFRDVASLCAGGGTAATGLQSRLLRPRLSPSRLRFCPSTTENLTGSDQIPIHDGVLRNEATVG
jgi:hypothetical protein